MENILLIRRCYRFRWKVIKFRSSWHFKAVRNYDCSVTAVIRGFAIEVSSEGPGQLRFHQTKNWIMNKWRIFIKTSNIHLILLNLASFYNHRNSLFSWMFTNEVIDRYMHYIRQNFKKKEAHGPHRSPVKTVKINKHIWLYHNVD